MTPLLRGLDPALVARVRAYADARRIPILAAVARLITAGLDHLAARRAGGLSANARLTPDERRARARRAILARWAKARAQRNDT